MKIFVTVFLVFGITWNLSSTSAFSVSRDVKVNLEDVDAGIEKDQTVNNVRQVRFTCDFQTFDSGDVMRNHIGCAEDCDRQGHIGGKCSGNTCICSKEILG